MSVLSRWKNLYHSRRVYATKDRGPFYDIADQYLPKNKDASIIDIGAGDGEFSNRLNLENRYRNVFLLDSSTQDTSSRGSKYITYTAPERLPFSDMSVSFVHTSHMVEHLESKELYRFLTEIDRVLVDDGVLMISAPLLWQGFYDDLSHVKPYTPAVFLKYLQGEKKQMTRKPVSEQYVTEKIVYRYRAVSFDEGWGSRFAVIDFFLYFLRELAEKIGIRKWYKNGFTLVLRKKTHG